MKGKRFILCGCFCVLLSAHLLSQKLWTEEDRAYLIGHLAQTRDSLIKETAHLNQTQWNFKESSDRWSIKEVTEHIGIWELLLMHEVSKALGAEPHPEWTPKPDSTYSAFILEEKPHVSVEYTKPFTYTLPLGLNTGINNVSWFLKMRNESIDFLKTAQEDLRTHYLKQGRPSVHQVYITIFGHCQRHLRQIRKIKANARYPKDKQ